MPRIREFRWDSWAARALEWLAEDVPTVVAVDTETTGLGFYDTPFAATLTWRSQDGGLRSVYIGLEGEGVEDRARILGTILRHTPVWVFHNAKFDLQKLLLVGAIDWADIEEHGLEDTQTIFHLLDENSPKGLKDLAISVLRHDDTILVPYKSGKKKGQLRPVAREAYRLSEVRRQMGLKKADGYFYLPREVVVPYALRDTEFTLRLYEALRERLTAAGDGELETLYEREMRLKLTLLRMLERGMQLDLDYLADVASEYGAKVMQGWGEIVALVGNPDFNPQSPQQLKTVFAERGIFLDSTARDELKKLDDDLARAILAYRDDKKIHTTYLKALQDEQRNGLVHPWFNEDGARTGRMSSGKANE